jgi:hypothetical protein
MPFLAKALLDKRARFESWAQKMGREALFAKHPAARGYLRDPAGYRLYDKREELMQKLFGDVAKQAIRLRDESRYPLARTEPGTVPATGSRASANDRPAKSRAVASTETGTFPVLHAPNDSKLRGTKRSGARPGAQKSNEARAESRSPAAEPRRDDPSSRESKSSSKQSNARKSGTTPASPARSAPGPRTRSSTNGRGAKKSSVESKSPKSGARK